MIENMSCHFKPKEEWREGMNHREIKKELECLVKFPGLTNAWLCLSKTRIEHAATGIKTQ